jgi:hypothetical protein
MAKPAPKSTPTPKPSPAPAAKPIAAKAPVATKVVAPKVTQSIASPFLAPTFRPVGNFLPNNMSTAGAAKAPVVKKKPVATSGKSSTLDNFVYQKQMDLSNAKKIAANAAKKNGGKIPSTLENYVYQSQLNLSQAQKNAKADKKPIKQKPSPDRVERMKPPTKPKATTKKTTTKKTAPKKTTTKKPVVTPPPVVEIPEVEIPVIDAVPYTPPSAGSGSPKPDTKPATPDLLMISDEAFPVELMTDLLFEDIGGTEILNIARHDLVDGAELSYQQISNMSRVTTISGGANLQSLTQTSEDVFSQFPLKRYQYVPESTDDPSGMNRNVYLNSNGDLVVELSGVDSSYQLEVSFQVGAVSDIIY